MEHSYIKIDNPITSKSIRRLFDQISESENKLLIIDTDKHEFDSIQSLKELKQMFSYNKDLFNRFKKIAFIHPVNHFNESSDTSKYRYFNDINDAITWFESDETLMRKNEAE